MKYPCIIGFAHVYTHHAPPPPMHHNIYKCTGSPLHLTRRNTWHLSLVTNNSGCMWRSLTWGKLDMSICPRPCIFSTFLFLTYFLHTFFCFLCQMEEKRIRHVISTNTFLYFGHLSSRCRFMLCFCFVFRFCFVSFGF